MSVTAVEDFHASNAGALFRSQCNGLTSLLISHGFHVEKYFLKDISVKSLKYYVLKYTENGFMGHFDGAGIATLYAYCFREVVQSQDYEVYELTDTSKSGIIGWIKQLNQFINLPIDKAKLTISGTSQACSNLLFRIMNVISGMGDVLSNDLIDSLSSLIAEGSLKTI
jgi:hypothetical protein